MTTIQRPVHETAALSSSDAIMWRIEADPVLRSPILVVCMLDREPADADVRAAMARWVEVVPRLGQRAVIAPRVRGGSRWVDDDQFSLDFHLRRVRAPRPGDLRSLLALAEPTATAPFDAARSPWDLTIVEGLDGGRAGLILRFHHTITDGVGGIALAGTLFDRRRGARPPKERTPVPATAPDGQRIDLDRLTEVVRGSARLASTAVQRGLHPRESLRDGLHLAGSIARALAPVPAPLSPLFGDRGLDRRLDVLELPLAGLAHTAATIGCTINDVFLAAVGGGLHDYHARMGHPVGALRFTMPISLRAEGDPEGGNRFAPARFVLPIDDPDLVVRARIARAITRQWRDEPALRMTDDLAALLDRLPGPVLTRIFATMLEHIDVDAVDVPGLSRAAFFAGCRVERMWAFAPPTGAALSVTLLSHVDTCCIAVNADRDAVQDPELLQSCFASAFDEVVSFREQPEPAGGVA